MSVTCTVLVRLVGVLVLVAINAFFVAVEFAVVAMRRTRIEELVGEGHAVARRLRQAHRQS